MSKLTPIEREQLEVAELHLARFMRTYKRKTRIGADREHLEHLESAANLLAIMQLK